MELHPCPCGEADFGAASSAGQRDGAWVVRYEGSCAECGRERAFEFRQPDQISVPDGEAWADGEQPSQLLDAGEWLYVADTYGSVPADTTGLSDVDIEQVQRDLSAAAAALDEVLKFVPAGAAAVPEEGFWSYRGQQQRRDEPGRFGRVRLEAARDAYRRFAAEVAAEVAGQPDASGRDRGQR